jgi:hypothetical protein
MRTHATPQGITPESVYLVVIVPLFLKAAL